MVNNGQQIWFAMVTKNIEVFLNSETKTDYSFPTAQYHTEGYTAPIWCGVPFHVELTCRKRGVNFSF